MENAVQSIIAFALDWVTTRLEDVDCDRITEPLRTTAPLGTGALLATNAKDMTNAAAALEESNFARLFIF